MIFPSEFTLRQENGRYTGALDLLVIQLRKGGERSAEPKKTIDLKLTPQRYQLMLQNGMILLKNSADCGEVGARGSKTLLVRNVLMWSPGDTREDDPYDGTAEHTRATVLRLSP
jgi:hypothetical protein